MKISIALGAAFLLFGCGSSPSENTATTAQNANGKSAVAKHDAGIHAPDPQDDQGDDKRADAGAKRPDESKGDSGRSMNEDESDDHRADSGKADDDQDDNDPGEDNDPNGQH
jgi:hypothetical protein